MSARQFLSEALEAAIRNPSLTFAISITPFVLYLVCNYFLKKPTSKNPFQNDSRRHQEPFVHDTKRRDAILKDRFKLSKIPDNLDAIIIGSGAGGLSTGALLAKAGKKVLVLDQHDQAGGCCHTFVEKGFEFDTGIHYIGNMHEGDMPRVLLDQLTSGQLRWAKMDRVFDTVAIGDPSNAKLFPMKSGDGDYYYENLIKLFPQEKTAILAYKDLIKDAAKTFSGVVFLKMLPRGFVNLLLKTGLHRLFFRGYRKGFLTKSLQEILDGLTDNKELKFVLSYICGDVGGLPNNYAFALHAAVVNSYTHGAFYPENGASEIAYYMIQVIQEAGGKVLVQAPVTNILCDSVGRAIGVRVGKGEVDIHAKNIISNAGVVNTFKKLLPEGVGRTSSQYQLIEQVGQSYSFLTFFFGIEGSSSELKLPAGNTWWYKSEDITKSVKEYMNTKSENVDTISIPFGFISCPSAKDPQWEKKFPEKSSVIACTAAKWEWFEEWKDEKVRHRGDRYEDIKDVLGRKMWQHCVDLFPQLDGKKVYMEVGTPVTNSYYLACPKGEMYGLDHNLSRYSAAVVNNLRPDTSVKGLYLTGQDVISAGFIPSILSGLMCASAVLHRNLFIDLVKLMKKVPKKSFCSNGSVQHKEE